MSGYRIIERTLCGGRDLFEHQDAKVIAQWLHDRGYVGNANDENKQDSLFYVLTPEGEELSSFKLLMWTNRQLGKTFIQRIVRKLRFKR